MAGKTFFQSLGIQTAGCAALQDDQLSTSLYDLTLCGAAEDLLGNVPLVSDFGREESLNSL